MGCGASSVPAIILPDPVGGQENKFLCKKKNLLSSDFEVFKDFDEKQKWLFIDKKGSIFKVKYWADGVYNYRIPFTLLKIMSGSCIKVTKMH